MRTRVPVVVLLVGLYAVASAALAGPSSMAPGDWPQWRGPLASGEAPGANPPIEWSETSGVRWKTPIPGMGASTPIVWGDTIYLQTAIPVGAERDPRQTRFAFGEDQNVYKGLAYVRATQDHEFSLVALDRATGAIRHIGNVAHRPQILVAARAGRSGDQNLVLLVVVVVGREPDEVFPITVTGIIPLALWHRYAVDHLRHPLTRLNVSHLPAAFCGVHL